MYSEDASTSGHLGNGVSVEGNLLPSVLDHLDAASSPQSFFAPTSFLVV